MKFEYTEVFNFKGNGAAWFTTTTGEAIDADTIIKWERLKTQQELEF